MTTTAPVLHTYTDSTGLAVEVTEAMIMKTLNDMATEHPPTVVEAALELLRMGPLGHLADRWIAAHPVRTLAEVRADRVALA